MQSKLKDLHQVTPALVKWYKKIARPLPWRENPEPYKIWISEIMSQQSTIPMMLPYYQKWMQRWPTLESLALAKEEEVLSLWQGLGYYSRARNILKGAHIIQEFSKAHKRLPRTPEEWIKVPGIGSYTASAITAISYNEATLPLDGNVFRVFSRYFGIKDPLNSREDSKKISELLQQYASMKHSSYTNLAQALMELGSQVCKPQERSLCTQCPLQSGCQALKEKTVAQWPLKKKRSQMQQLTNLGIIYRNQEGKILLRKIPTGQRLEGQWELPFWELQDNPQKLLKNLGPTFEVRGPYRHTITHHQYRLYAVEAGRWPAKDRLPEGHRFIDEEDYPHLAVTQASKKVLAHI